jgi:hypothetical protein
LPRSVGGEVRGCNCGRAGAAVTARHTARPRRAAPQRVGR